MTAAGYALKAFAEVETARRKIQGWAVSRLNYKSVHPVSGRRHILHCMWRTGPGAGEAPGDQLARGHPGAGPQASVPNLRRVNASILSVRFS